MTPSRAKTSMFYVMKIRADSGNRIHDKGVEIPGFATKLYPQILKWITRHFFGDRKEEHHINAPNEQPTRLTSV